MIDSDIESEKEKKSGFEKFKKIVLLVMQIVLFLITIIFFVMNILKNDFLITKENIFLIILILVITIGSSYDKISIAKILEFKKERDERKKEADEYKDRYDAIARDFSAVLIQNQKQVINNYNKNENNITELEKADRSEKEELEKLDDNSSTKKSRLNLHDNHSIEEKLWDLYKAKYCELQSCSVQNDVKLSSSNSSYCVSTVFDRYYRINNVEYFVEFKLLSQNYYGSFHMDLERKLTLLNQRQNENEARVKLHFVIGYDSKSLEPAKVFNAINQLNTEFSPSIANSVLKIIPIDIA